MKENTRWLVTGGAGYIGSHVVDCLEKSGIETIAFDNLSTGSTEFLSTTFIEGDVTDFLSLNSAIKSVGNVDGIIHLAGYKYAGQSVKYPLQGYVNNVQGTLNVLRVMGNLHIKKLVFSSSAAVYGPSEHVLTERANKRPTTPYGRSKLMCEQIIKDYAKAQPLDYTCLRYMNVIGASEVSYDKSPYNLLPIIIKDLTEGRTPRIYGTDYDTYDGTCVRDYVDVRDIARAHLLAVQGLGGINHAYNLGTSRGFSVRDIMKTLREVSGIDFEPIEFLPRDGDSPFIVASNAHAWEDLGWEPEHLLTDSVRSAWVEYQKRLVL